MKRRIRFESVAVVVVTLLLLIVTAPYARQYVETRRCGKRLAVISQAARVWGDAHQGRLPSSFLLMSNELVSPRLLLCPGDKLREPADNWQALTSANSSYRIDEGAQHLPPEILRKMPYLGCKVHANYADAFGEVSVNDPPIPHRVYFLGGLALVVLLSKRWWHHYKPVAGEVPSGTAAGALLPRIEQVRRDYLAAGGTAPGQWFRKGLLAAARHALRTLPFFRDRQDEPQVREN